MSVPCISFRPLRSSDFPLLRRWLTEPHVETWWHEPSTLPEIEAKYRPRIDGSEPTQVFLIWIGDPPERPIGWIQWYRWSDYPEHGAKLAAEPTSAGIDLAIGEKDQLGLGLGPEVIRQFLRQEVFADCGITAVIADPEIENHRSQRAFVKAGFTPIRTVRLPGENVQRQIVRLDRAKGMAGSRG